MKKQLAFLLALLLTLSLAGCKRQTLLGEARAYPVSSDVHSLELRINAADITIREADAFSVESNLKHLSVSVEDGVLTIREESKHSVTYSDAMLTLWVPAGTVFETAELVTGAAKLTADTLCAGSLKLQLGAGDVRFEYLSAVSNAEIEGGAGRITIADGTLRDLELEMGVGELNLTAALLGDSDLSLGVGASNLTLLGSRDSYQLELKKGLGSITLDGTPIPNSDRIGSGQNHVEVIGGVGSITLTFREVQTL